MNDKDWDAVESSMRSDYLEHLKTKETDKHIVEMKLIDVCKRKDEIIEKLLNFPPDFCEDCEAKPEDAGYKCEKCLAMIVRDNAREEIGKL